MGKPARRDSDHQQSATTESAVPLSCYVAEGLAVSIAADVPPTALTQFQHTYSQYLRAPSTTRLPEGIPEQRSRVYESLLFNNVCGFINKCFPVAKKMVGETRWTELIRLFYERWQCHTPIFSQIPKEFVDFIAAHDVELTEPAWLAELLHYEWLELEVDLDTGQVDRVHLLTDADTVIFTNPTLRLQQYQWPVHQLGPNNLPTTSQATILCVYRTHEFQVRFMEVNAVTGILLELLQDHPQTSQAALRQLIQHLPQLEPAQIERFGGDLIQQLVQANVLIVQSNGLNV
jgi:uncharacterized protein